MLEQHGWTHVRPLRGGFDAWRPPATRRRPKRPGLWSRRTLLSMEDALRVVRYYCSTPVVSPGGSLAGNDSDDASSTLSQASPTVGVSAAGGGACSVVEVS